MDTSKTYIEMCKQATEIQALWLNHDTEGDFAVPTKTINGYQGFWTLRADEVYIVGNDDEYDLDIVDQKDIERTGSIWLMRQDQLQDMIGDYQDCLSMIDRYDATSSVDFDYPEAQSMEQLWLMIVMKENYDKKWNGNDWIK